MTVPIQLNAICDSLIKYYRVADFEVDIVADALVDNVLMQWSYGL